MQRRYMTETQSPHRKAVKEFNPGELYLDCGFVFMVLSQTNNTVSAVCLKNAEIIHFQNDVHVTVFYGTVTIEQRPD